MDDSGRLGRPVRDYRESPDPSGADRMRERSIPG